MKVAVLLAVLALVFLVFGCTQSGKVACGDNVCAPNETINCPQDCNSSGGGNTVTCTSDDDCMESSCPNGGFVHQTCVNSQCIWGNESCPEGGASVTAVCNDDWTAYYYQSSGIGLSTVAPAGKQNSYVCIPPCASMGGGKCMDPHGQSVAGYPTCDCGCYPVESSDCKGTLACIPQATLEGKYFDEYQLRWGNPQYDNCMGGKDIYYEMIRDINRPEMLCSTGYTAGVFHDQGGHNYRLGEDVPVNDVPPAYGIAGAATTTMTLGYECVLGNK